MLATPQDLLPSPKLVACGQCGDLLVAAERSEHVSEHCVRNHFCCERCGHAFAQAVYVPGLGYRVENADESRSLRFETGRRGAATPDPGERPRSTGRASAHVHRSELRVLEDVEQRC